MLSKQLADGFSSGSILPILQAMTEEFPAQGVQENRVISKLDFASFHIGRFVAQFPRNSNSSYGWIDLYVHQDGRKDYDFKKTLQKSSFVNAALSLSESDRNILAEIVLLDEQFINPSKFMLGLMEEEKQDSRRKIGSQIRQLREEKGWSQQELADRAGLKQPNLARIETAKYGSSLDVLSKIAEALEKELKID